MFLITDKGMAFSQYSHTVPFQIRNHLLWTLLSQTYYNKSSKYFSLFGTLQYVTNS